MNSCLLYHGPDAESYALQQAELAGRLLAPPFGKDGLKVDDARQIVSLLGSTPVGMQVGVVVVGPMELANSKSSDVLLKSIEEFQGGFVRPILWANDIGGVTSTIRSRCIDVWVPRSKPLPNDVVQQGEAIISDCLAQKFYMLPTLLDKSELTEVQLLDTLVFSLVGKLEDEGARGLWERLRLVGQWRNPTRVEILSALIGDV